MGGVIYIYVGGVSLYPAIDTLIKELNDVMPKYTHDHNLSGNLLRVRVWGQMWEGGRGVSLSRCRIIFKSYINLCRLSVEIGQFLFHTSTNSTWWAIIVKKFAGFDELYCSIVL